VLLHNLRCNLLQPCTQYAFDPGKTANDGHAASGIKGSLQRRRQTIERTVDARLLLPKHPGQLEDLIGMTAKPVETKGPQRKDPCGSKWPDGLPRDLVIGILADEGREQKIGIKYVNIMASLQGACLQRMHAKRGDIKGSERRNN